jgi:hypothetical protein
LTNRRMAAASRSQFPVAKPWYAMSKKQKCDLSSISLLIACRVGGRWRCACVCRTQWQCGGRRWRAERRRAGRLGSDTQAL